MSAVISRPIRASLGFAFVLASTVVLAACGGGADNSSSASQAPASQAPSSQAPSSQAPVGGNPGTWTPITITAADNGRTISMVPDQVALLEGLPMNDGEELNVSVSDDSVVAFERAEGDPSGVSAGPAIIAKAPGTSTVTFTYDEQGSSPGANVAFEVTITVAAQ